MELSLVSLLVKVVKELEAFPYENFYNNSKNARHRQSSVALIFRVNRDEAQSSKYKLNSTSSPQGEKLGVPFNNRISSQELESILLSLSPCEKNPIDMLFIKRKTDVKDSHSGYMALPGGKLDGFNETDFETVVREVREELGADLTQTENVKYLGKIPKNFRGVYGKNSTLIFVAVHLFLITNSDAVSFELNPDEIERIVWVPWSLVTNPEENRLIHRFIDMKQLFSSSFPYEIQIHMDKYFKPHYKITEVACYVLDEEGNGIFALTLYLILYLIDVVLAVRKNAGLPASEERKILSLFNKMFYWKTIFSSSTCNIAYNIIYDRVFHYYFWVKQHRFKRFSEIGINKKSVSTYKNTPSAKL